MKLDGENKWQHWFDVKGIIFGYAVFNMVLLRTEVFLMGNIAALVDPWFRPWSYLNEPGRLLLAASLLLIGRRWSYYAAIGLTAYMVIRYVYLFALYGLTLSYEWSYLSKNEPYFVGSFDSQYFLALIILCSGTVYLVKDLMPSTRYRDFERVE
jgi:hypothetical protein